MTIFLIGMITSVVLLVPALYFFIEKKYKLMTVVLIVNLLVTATLIYISQLFRS
jgi:hypothetical protein